MLLDSVIYNCCREHVCADYSVHVHVCDVFISVKDPSSLEGVPGR